MEGLLKNQGLNPLVHMGIWGIWNSFWVFKNQEDETKNPEGMNIYKQKKMGLSENVGLIFPMK